MVRLTRTVCIFCLSALLGLLPAGSEAQEFVLCSGENGHIAIEAAGSICCTDISESHTKASASSPIEERPHADDHCGECVDIPLSVGLATITKDRCQAGLAAPVLVASGLVNFTTLNIAWQVLPVPSVSPDNPTPLSSVILQI